MIPIDRADLLDLGLGLLEEYGQRTQARGRFIALYLGLRQMGPALAPLGAATSTPAGDIERFLDGLYQKTHREEPFVVLTAPFGGSTSPNAPYSARSGQKAPGNSYPTNTWRNNFGIQKGVGCPAEAAVIGRLIQEPTLRLACPHMAIDTEGRYSCGLQGTTYRGEEHSIWLRQAGTGYQVVDLDEPGVYTSYLRPSDTQIPIFPLIAAIYCKGPGRELSVVGIPEFAKDFRFEIDRLATIFDCDQASEANATILEAVGTPSAAEAFRERVAGYAGDANRAPGAIPVVGGAIELNTGVGAEIEVARDLQVRGWEVGYTGNQRSRGHDLEARRAAELLRVEVKSSVAFANVELLPSEWAAAQEFGDSFVLAVVDFYGSPEQRIWYVRDPASVAVPAELLIPHYKFPRSELLALATESEFL